MLSILPIRNLRTYRRHYSGLTKNLLSSLAGITANRLQRLEIGASEPFFDEACKLAAILNCDVMSLIAQSDIDQMDLDPSFYADDVPWWREGKRLALYRAIRLAHRFGLERVEDLDVPRHVRQIWSVLEATERHPEASGWCAWCQSDIVAGEPHRAHCLPSNLFGGRHTSLTPVVNDQAMDAGRRAVGKPAKGLKALREHHRWTQARMAALMGYDTNHYSRIERCENNLKLAVAKGLAAKLGLPDISVIYADPALVAPSTMPLPAQGTPRA